MSPRFAESEAGERVAANNTTGQSGPYSCCHCGAEMILAGGTNTRVRKHFRHPPGKSCRAYGQNLSEPVEEVHDQVRFEIAEELRASEWANRIREEWQVGDTVADVLFDTGSGRVAIEVQVSGMSADELISRTQRHTARGVATMWVFYPETYRNETTSKNGNQYLTFRSAIMGYTSIAGEDRNGDVHVPFHTTDAPGALPVEFVRISPFEDGNGGFPEQRSSPPPIETYRSISGESLATSDAASLDSCGDPHQKRLFV